jgi:hypothetical protein
MIWTACQALRAQIAGRSAFHVQSSAREVASLVKKCRRASPPWWPIAGTINWGDATAERESIAVRTRPGGIGSQYGQAHGTRPEAAMQAIQGGAPSQLRKDRRASTSQSLQAVILGVTYWHHAIAPWPIRSRA